MQVSSQWKKWDLHIHTPDSFENHFSFENETEKTAYSGKIWDKYVKELENVKEISVIGITDYFTIEGYKKILAYKQNDRLKNFDLILSNIELRLDILSGTDNKRLNFHIIFSDEIEPNEIEEHFLHSLEFQTGKGEIRRLTKRNIEEIGHQLKTEHPTFRGTDFEVGCKNITVSIDKIQDILEKSKSKFFGKYLLILSAREWDDIGWNGQGHIIKKHSLFKSHAVFSANPGTIDFCLGKKHPSVDEFEKEFGPIKPCIHGSDAHSFDYLCKPDGEKFCWIKAIPTFDGLKQIIFEPQGRVKIQNECPELYKNIYTLNSVEFFDSGINDEISIAEQIIQFNKNFVAITGGKGSGKTAILDLIANCYIDRCKRKDDENRDDEDKNSFVQRIQNDGKNIGIKIDFIDDSIEHFSKKLTDLNFIEKSVITYLPQGKIEEISGDKVKLNEKIQEIIFNNEKVKENNYKEKFFEIKENIAIISKGIVDYNTKISTLNNETTPEIFTELNSENQIAEGKLADIKNQIQRIEANLEQGIQEKIFVLKKEIKRNKGIHSNCSEIIAEINLLMGGVQNFVISSNKTITSINKKVQEIEIDNPIPEIDLINQINALDQIKISLEDKKVSLEEETLAKEKSLIELSGEEKTHTKLIKETELIENELKKISEKIEKVLNKKTDISRLESERFDLYERLLISIKDWKKYYDNVIEAFSEGKNEILGDINFKSNVEFNYENFFVLAHDIINRKKIPTEQIEIRTKEIQEAISDYLKDKSDFGDIKTAFNLFLDEKRIVKKNRSNRDFYDWLFGNYFTLITEIDFKGTSIDKLSMGQKGTVLLKLFLAEGDYPIILDQPEENLDNKFIYDELVSAMRNAKNNRQVIIATNNANLVVNTDADQIIIAEFADGKISYKTGALESPNIRQEIMPLLEGGQEAFKKREQKYGILGYRI